MAQNLNKKQHNKFTKVFDIKDHETLTALKTSKGLFIQEGEHRWSGVGWHRDTGENYAQCQTEGKLGLNPNHTGLVLPGTSGNLF